MYNYPPNWSSDLSAPSLKLQTRSWTYHLGVGEVPDILAHHPDVYAGNPFKLHALSGVNLNLTGYPTGNVDGHHAVLDTGFTALLETDPRVPAMPAFVRDIAGRAIYLGGPLIKGLQEWQAYGAQRLNEEGDIANPMLPFITFPRFCADAADMPGYEYLETVFLTRFRMLDMSVRAKSIPSGSDEDADNIAMSYTGANLYPYKWRLDTFYIDGYKLPQTTMLFARSEGIRPTAAKTLGEDFLKRWEARPANQSYQDFLASQPEDFAEGMYQQGCTLIPTFEARNGLHVVSESFELEDYWPGRNVPGLHAIAEVRDDTAPEGTILEVITPGFITSEYVSPAVVVVSSGSGYVSPHASNPAPFVPNLYLPHQRTLSNWRATWLPTHPLHFEAPALWGFDILTGHFLQLNGPLWDPLHYYYSCTETIIQASKKPLSMEQNRYFIPVPDEMEGRFHPIVPLMGFDVLSFEALERKREDNRRPFSLVTRYRSGKETAGIGYHPLPIEFEYELDPFWFPTLHPLNREHGLEPEDLADRVAPIIRPKVGVDDYLQRVNAPESLYWLLSKDQLAQPSENPFENYPQLLRFVAPNLPLESILPLIPLPFLADPGEELLSQPTEKYFEGEDSAERLAEIDGEIFDSWWDAREQGHQWVKFRHLLYRQALELYALGWWYGASPLLLEEMLADWLQTEDQQDRATTATTRLQR